MFQHEIHQCTCFLNVEHVIARSTRCFPHHWSVQIEACPLLSAHPSSHGHILSSTLILMKGRVCFRQIQKLMCLPPLRVLLLCNHVCSMTLIRAALVITIRSETLRWCRCLEVCFMDRLNCAVFTIVIGEALETVHTLSFSSTVL